MSDLFGSGLRPRTILDSEAPDEAVVMPIADRQTTSDEASDAAVDLLGRVIFSEASNDPSEMNGVAWVVRNRMQIRRKSMRDVVYEEYAPDKHEFNAVDDPRWSLWNLSDADLPPGEIRKREYSLKTARDILEGRIEDPTGGATYFHSNPTTPPGFMADRIKSDRFVPTVKLGKTTFLKEIQPQRWR